MAHQNGNTRGGGRAPVVPAAEHGDIELARVDKFDGQSDSTATSSWETDPENPYNWPAWKKWLQLLMICFVAFTG